MARIVADRGYQPDWIQGSGRYMSFEMDCGCEIRVAERVMLSGSRSSGVDLRDRLNRVAAAHDCEVVVHHAPERYRREIRQRREFIDPPIRYMGMDVSTRPDVSTFLDWQQEVIAAFAMPSRTQSAPQTAPEQEVRRAAERLRGLQVSPAPVGFKAPDPPKKEPEKKEDPPKLDRFQLLDLD